MQVISRQTCRGFLHSEGAGVVAIDPTGVSGTNKKTLRLYVYPDEETCTLYVLLLGDKSTQNTDVRLCLQTAREIIASRANEKGSREVKKKDLPRRTGNQSDPKTDKD